MSVGARVAHYGAVHDWLMRFRSLCVFWTFGLHSLFFPASEKSRSSDADVKSSLIYLGVALVVLPVSSRADTYSEVVTESISGDRISLSSTYGVVTGTQGDWDISFGNLDVDLSTFYLPQNWVGGALSDYTVLSVVDSETLNVSLEASPAMTNNDDCGTGTPLNLGVSCKISKDDDPDPYFGSVLQVVNPVPEPASFLALGFGVAAIAGLRRRWPAKTVRSNPCVDIALS